jgi:lysophospholipase L1-like esterase
VGSWANAPQTASGDELDGLHDRTLRLVAHLSIGGNRVRLKISNLFGSQPVRIAGIHVALRDEGPRILPASDRTVLFDGKEGIEIAAGTAVTSDPVDLLVPPLADLAVSLYLPDSVKASTAHLLALETGYVSAKPGNSSGAVSFDVGRRIDCWPFLTGIDVEGPPGAFAIVALGDSTVDGDGSTPDANHRWTDRLAARFAKSAMRVGLLNEGLIGNRLLRGSPEGPENPLGRAMGESALERFDRDVLAQAGVRAVILRTGSNDLGLPGGFAPASELPSLSAMENGYRRIVAQAKARRLTIIGTTLPPFENAGFPGYFSLEKEALRQALNAWIRQSGTFDAVIDLDLLLRDPNHPSRLLADFDSGDHLHPNDVGYDAIAEAIPLALFPN